MGDESDWKKFREITPVLRERYIAERNRRLERILADPGRTETERFWKASELLEKEARVLRRCLDGHSRSKMWLYLLEMKRAGMLRPEDMTGFSEKLRGEVFDDPRRFDAGT